MDTRQARAGTLVGGSGEQPGGNVEELELASIGDRLSRVGLFQTECIRADKPGTGAFTQDIDQVGLADNCPPGIVSQALGQKISQALACLPELLAPVPVVQVLVFSAGEEIIGGSARMDQDLAAKLGTPGPVLQVFD